MIKFFRKIRYDLMGKNKTGKYLKYAIGEVFLVMIGILLALQVNNWNENRKLESKTQDYYIQLLEDLKNDIEFVENTIKESNNYLKEYEMYTKSYNKDLLTPIQVYEQISKLNILSVQLSFNTSTLESLQNSGDVGLIPSNIRNRLLDLIRLQNLTAERFAITDDGKNDIIKNLNPLLGSSTLPKRLLMQPKMKKFFNIEENIKELILVYEGIHRWKSVAHQEAKGRLEKMLKEIDSIVGLINKELKK